MKLSARILKSDLFLLAAAVIWGTTFVAQRVGMMHLGPMAYSGLRFALGAATLVPVILLIPANRQIRDPGGDVHLLLWGGGLAGLALFGGTSMQQIGLIYTTAGKAGFITGLYVVLVPIIGRLLRQKIGSSVWAGMALAIAGLYLLSVTGSLTIGRGDLFVLGGAFFWAVHVHLIGYLAKRTNPLHIAFLQLVICSVLSLLAAALFEEMAVASIRRAALPILYGGILSVGVAFTLQILGQRASPPSHAAIVMSLETVFAALSGYVVLNEHLTPRGLAGCALMLAGFVVVQLPLLRRPRSGISPRS